MPLKLEKSPDRPNFTIRGTYLGRYVKQSAGTSKRAVAVKVLRAIERQIERGEYGRGDEPTFASAALNYMNAGGERTYVGRLLDHFGNTPLSRIDQAVVDRAGVELYPDGSPATINRSVYTPVSAILRRAGVSLSLKRPKGSAGNKQTAWLWPEQAHALLEEAEKLDPEFGALCTILLYTGLRLSEALGLTWNDVRLQDGFAYVPDTKSGEPRSVFLPPVAVAALANRDRNRQHERVFRFAKSGRLYSLLRATAFRASVELPKRSAFHIFRHTYATWMRRFAGADAQTLVATGAWKDRKSVERYAHTIVSEESQRAALLPTKARKG